MVGKKDKKEEKQFRLRTKRFYLTYPQLPADYPDLKELALSNFERIFGLTRYDFTYAICVEKHEDGNPHIHAYLSFPYIQKVYSANRLDLIMPAPHEDVTFHGNYQSVRSEHQVLSYLLKTVVSPEDFVTNRPMPVLDGVYYSNPEEHIFAVCRKEGLKNSVNILFSMYPKLAVNKAGSIIANLTKMDQHFFTVNNPDPEPRALEDFVSLPATILSWIDDNYKRQVLFLWGPSGTGKTQLAKAIMKSMGFEFLMVRDLNGLSKFKPTIHKAIIFDDLDVTDMSREQIIHLFDNEEKSEIRILYQVINIPAGTVKIFTTNTPSAFHINDPAVRRRMMSVEIRDPMYLLEDGSDPVLPVDPVNSKLFSPLLSGPEVASPDFLTLNETIARDLASTSSDLRVTRANFLVSTMPHLAELPAVIEVLSATPVDKSIKAEVTNPFLPSTILAAADTARVSGVEGNPSAITGEASSTVNVDPINSTEPVKKKRGRPKGSKNKNK